jgi:hypothetical protein
LHHLKGWDGGGELFGQPWVGQSWEGWVIEQIISARQALGHHFTASYFRTSDGHEIDLVIEQNGEIEAIEIKSTSSPSREDVHHLQKAASLIGAGQQVLLSRTSEVAEGAGVWSGNLAAYLSRFTALPDALPRPIQRWEAANLFHRMKGAAPGLIQRGIVSEKSLLERATWLAEDIIALRWQKFTLLPLQFVRVEEQQMPLLEYEFGLDPAKHNVENAQVPSQVSFTLNTLEGTGLNRNDLFHLTKCLETAHRLIPQLWPHPDPAQARGMGKTLDQTFVEPNEHMSTLEELWWLGRWHGVDAGSVIHGWAPRAGEAEYVGKSPPNIDWRFSVLSRQIWINLEVKNRPGTHRNRLYGTPVDLFSEKPEEKFRPSADDEINVLAMTIYTTGFLESHEGPDLIQDYLDHVNFSERGALLDAVVIWTPFETEKPASQWQFFFPTNRNLQRKDLLLKAIWSEPDAEDKSRIAQQTAPLNFDELIRRFEQ